jgi:hypothetical protein
MFLSVCNFYLCMYSCFPLVGPKLAIFIIGVLLKLPRAHLVVVEQGAQLQKAPHEGTMMIKIIYMCFTRNGCTPTCTPRAKCRRASCLGLGIINNFYLCMYSCFPLVGPKLAIFIGS